MDISEQKYKKIVSQYKPYLNYVISEYPIPQSLRLEHHRNLKYIIEKEKYSNGFCSDTYDEIIQQVKALLDKKQHTQYRLFGVRLLRCLPFYYRLKAIEDVGNQLSDFMQRQGTVTTKTNQIKGQSTPNQSAPQFHYQSIADMTDLLLSVYELSALSDEIYFNVNQKVTSIFSRIVQNYASNDRNLARNSYQALRSIFMVFGECKSWKYAMKMLNLTRTQAPSNFSQQQYLLALINSETIGNKLINKIISLFSAQQNYYLPSNTNGFTSINTSNLSAYSHLRHLIFKTRQYQIRIRCRMLTSISYLVTYIPEPLPQIYELISSQIFLILQNANQFETNLQCFVSIKALLSLPLSHGMRTRILKKWVQILSELNSTQSYKKQYYEFYIRILKQVSQYEYCPLKIRYFASINYLQITNFINQQYSRFIIYKFACKNIMTITDEGRYKRKQFIPNHNNKKLSEIYPNYNNIVMNLFQYTWFINRINQDNDLFRSQFLICLLHAYFMLPARTQQMQSFKEQVKDLLSLCHRLLDWQCSCKQQTHIPTIKFAFDLYLQFLKSAAENLGDQIQQFLIQLIQRANQPKMYLLFKFKLISTFVKIPTYKNHIIPYSQTKLDLEFIEGQIRPFMMPTNFKPIFQYEYSLTEDGQIQSRKQIQTIKVIMSLLNAIQDIHKQVQQIALNMIIDYHQYLNKLQMQPTSNKDLINCLQSLQADHYFNQSQRNFLLSLIDDNDHRGNNTQYTLDQRIVYSPLEVYDNDQQYNIFGNMSPVHLKIRIIGNSGYDTVYIEIKKNNWASVSDLNLVVSSAVQIKEIPFQSGIIEIKVDRIGLLNFEAWTVQQPKLMLGSGSHKIKLKHIWLKLDHLRFIDGIRSKAFLNLSQLSQNKTKSQLIIPNQINSEQMIKQQPSNIIETKKTNVFRKDTCYLTFCFGEPLLLQIIYSKNQIIVTVSNRQIWNQVQGMIVEMVDQLIEGSAQIL